MTGKVCLVTGANSGIGKVTARVLAEMGAHVIMVSRDSQPSRRVLGEIREAAGAESVELFTCDLSSQREIRSLAARLHERYDRLDVLINNAGVIKQQREVTVDGLDATFATNHLAYFLVTNLLLDLIKKSAPARIINVASVAHTSAILDFDDLQSEKAYRAMSVYGRSKLANILFTYELARRLAGTAVTANCLHPGVIATGIAREMPSPIKLALKLLFKRPRKGAETTIYLATSSEVEGVTGKYFVDKKQVTSSAASYDRTVADRLWHVSEELTGLSI